MYFLIVLGVLILLAAAGIIYLYRQKSAHPKTEESPSVLINNINTEEEDVPLFECDPQQPVPPAKKIQKPESDSPAQTPDVTVADDLLSNEILRKHPDIDTVIESAIRFKPQSGFFDTKKLVDVEHLVAALSASIPCSIHFFNSRISRWSHHVIASEQCSEFYFTMLLANRTYQATQDTAAEFISLATRIASELDAAVELPGADTLAQRAQEVRNVIDAFAQCISIHLAGQSDISESDLHQAALATGFVYTDSCYEKRDSSSDVAVMTLSTTEQTNTLSLSFHIGILPAASLPLGLFFSTANDLSCRLNLNLEDISGQPITSTSASFIQTQLDDFYDTMSRNGVPAGSLRARRILSKS